MRKVVDNSIVIHNNSLVQNYFFANFSKNMPIPSLKNRSYGYVQNSKKLVKKYLPAAGLTFKKDLKGHNRLAILEWPRL